MFRKHRLIAPVCVTAAMSVNKDQSINQSMSETMTVLYHETGGRWLS